MSEKKLELNRRRVLGGIATIGAASAAIGAGTFAYFTDSEQSTGNTITAASLDLSIDGANNTATTTVQAGTSGTGIVPGDSGSGSSSITNTGSIAGYVDASIAETSAGSLSGDLASNLQVDVYIDNDNDTSTTGDQSQVVSDVASNIAGDYEVDHNLASGATSNLVVEWSLPSSVTVGEGETVQFDVTVILDQTTGQ